MAADSDNEKIDRTKVIVEFDERAKRLKNADSVLDANTNANTKHANIYRDYFTKYFPKKALAPKPTDVLLDFGCGMGRLSTYFAPYVKHIEGVDASSEMIKVAQQNNRFANINYSHITGNTLPFANSCFSAVITCWVLQHISDEDLTQLFAQFNRVLQPGGRLILLEQTKNQSATVQHIHTFRTLEHYCQLAAGGGFTVLKAQRVVKVPSRGMSIWSKLNSNRRPLLVALQALDRLLLNRKPELAKYYSSLFIFKK